MEDHSQSEDASAASWIEDAFKPNEGNCDDDKNEGDEILDAEQGHRPSLQHSSSIKEEMTRPENEEGEFEDGSYTSALPGEPTGGLRRSQPALQAGPGAFAVSSSGASYATAMSHRTETEYSITESEQASNQRAYTTGNVPEAPEANQSSNITAYETTGELVPEADPVDGPQEEENHRNAEHDVVQPEVPTVVGTAIDEAGKLRRKKRTRMFILLLGIVAIVAIVIAVTFATRNRGSEENSPSPTENPTISPSAPPTTSYVGLVIDTLVESGVDVPSFLDQGQVGLFFNQRRAIVWLTETDEIGLDLRPEFNDTNSTQLSPSDMLLERYAVLVVLFALAADNEIPFVKVSNSVCSWNLDNERKGIVCDENGSVKFAWLGQNNFGGTLATEISMLSNLRKFAIDSNEKVHSTIPSELFGISTLTHAYIGHNELTGTIPTEIQNAHALDLIWLNDNDLTGTLHTEIGALSLLVEFSTLNNLMTGPIPTEIGRMTTLTALDLEGNDFDGSIPSEFGLLPNLVSMNLHYNLLTSTIPSEVGNMNRLLNFGVFRNLLTGTLPTEFGNCPFFERLNMFGNQGITGTIPSELGLLPLATVFIGNTSLTGTVPNSFQNITTLQQFVAYKTPLSGSVDDILCNRENSLFIIFDYCRQGEIERSNVTCSCCIHCGGFFTYEPLSDYEG